jgi:hypothetical protein
MRAILVVAALALTLHSSVGLAGDASFSDTARYLAGLNPSRNSPLRVLTDSAEWKQHSSLMNASWAEFERTQLSHIRAFSKKVIPAAQQDTAQQDIVYYMFSGPDYPYVDLFFPRAKTYILSGLESIGSLPDLSGSTSEDRSLLLAKIRWSLRTFIRYGFFKTREMNEGNAFSGVVPLICIFIARSGHDVRDIARVSLRSDGTITDDKDQGEAPAIKITIEDARRQIKELYYFKVDLSNDRLRRTSLLKFLATLGTGNSLVKSASYLMHGEDFSDIREFLIANSALVVQDDTGIPLAQFKKDDWKIRLFGNYRPPLGEFSKYYQADLERLQQEKSVKPLKFAMGYLWGIGGSHVEIIERAKTLRNRAQAAH